MVREAFLVPQGWLIKTSSGKVSRLRKERKSTRKAARRISSGGNRGHGHGAVTSEVEPIIKEVFVVVTRDAMARDVWRWGSRSPA